MKKFFKKIKNYFHDMDKTRFLIMIGMLYATIFFSSFIMGYKVVYFCGRIFCASVFIFPLLFPINDSVTELFGIKTSYFIIMAIIICEILFSVITSAVAALPSPSGWPHQEIYTMLTKEFLQITLANSTSLAIGFFANAYFLNKWGIILNGRGFLVRSIGATAIGELVFTISTNLITFNTFHVADIHQTINIISSDYIFKMIYSIIICFPNALLVNKLKILYPHEVNTYPCNVIPLSSIKKGYRI